MEGVTDAPMRELMGQVGGYSYGVTEFIRISNSVPHTRTLKRIVPELNTRAMTRSGLKVQVQLLGGNPELCAEAAANACEAGAIGIDLNFGCPAPTVNKNDGGATLLLYPDRLEKIIQEVRIGVPKHIPVSAKLRLGWENEKDIYQTAERAVKAGASWITIHARTKIQGYKPPAHWNHIGVVKKQLGNFPIVANGDIWTLDDFKRCKDITDCNHFMLGRSALARPHLAAQISKELGLKIFDAKRLSSNEVYASDTTDWHELFSKYIKILSEFGFPEHAQLKRLKQWASMTHSAQPKLWVGEFKLSQNISSALACLKKYEQNSNTMSSSYLQ